MFASPPWLRALADTYGFDMRAVLHMETGTPAAGLPFAVIDDSLGRRLAAMAFSDYCDPIGANGQSWDALGDALLELETPVRLRCLHAEAPLRDIRFEYASEAGWHAMDISRDTDEIWTAIAGSARRSIRKARARELTVRVADDAAAVELFHEFHSEVRRSKYRMLAQPLSFFKALQKEFAPSGGFAVLVAALDAHPVAATLFLAWQDTLYYKFNASRADALELRPNDLLIWAGIEHGKSLGLSRLDFGLSDLDQPGLNAFKEKYATETGRITSLCDARAHDRAALEPELRTLLGELTELFTADGVPAELTRLAGSRLYRYFA